MTRRWMAVLALLALGGAAGCRTLARQAMANPVVEVKDVVIKGLGFQGGTLDVILDVYNPNEFRMDATRITYEVWVDSGRVADGAIDQRLTLNERGRSSVTVPVNFTYAAVNVAMQKFLQQGALDYRVTGQFTYVTPFGSITRPYAGAGRMTGLP